MSGDLVSLRLLLVNAVPSEQDLWRQGAALAAVPIEFTAHDVTAACKELGRGGVDICIIDSLLAAESAAAAINAARASDPNPFVVVSVPDGSDRFAGCDATLAKPGDAEQARELVDLCARTRIPTRVLIVDDSGTIRSIVRKILSASRYVLDVHEAGEGIAALGQLRTGRFGMVFLDYNMPGLNGFETLSEIKRGSPGIGVVMMTSQADENLSERARNGGALALLKKPFYPADIDMVLARYFGFDTAQ